MTKPVSGIKTHEMVPGSTGDETKSDVDFFKYSSSQRGSFSQVAEIVEPPTIYDSRKLSLPELQRRLGIINIPTIPTLKSHRTAYLMLQKFMKDNSSYQGSEIEEVTRKYCVSVIQAGGKEQPITFYKTDLFFKDVMLTASDQDANYGETKGKAQDNAAASVLAFFAKLGK